MTAIKYPEDGLYKTCYLDISELQGYLNSAVSYTNFDIPLLFAYRGYLNRLDNTINSYNKELQNIMAAAKKVDTNFDVLESDIRTSINAIDKSKMKERERLIK
ncbi:MAG: hypothetical protein IJO63_05645 [Bacilli bacterium]|nr:hypothetical protein [Bacilli bacterium]